MNYEQLSKWFLASTWVDLWEGVQKYAFPMGFYFVDFEDFLDWVKDNPVECEKLVSTLIRTYTKSIVTISDKRMIFAIASSLYNSRFDTPRKRVEDTYISKLFITQDEAKTILSYYWNFMSNPIAYAVDNEHAFRSMISWRNLNQANIYIANWKNSRRIAGAFASKGKYSLLDIDYVDIDMYHPTVWYILKEKKLWEYEHLFSSAKQLCEKWISNCTQKPQKIQEESNSFLTMGENITL